MGRLFPAGYQFTDGTNATPAVSGSLKFTVSGSSTSKAVFSDAARTVSLGNVVNLDSEGRTVSEVFGSGQFRIALYAGPNATGTVHWTKDDCAPYGDLDEALDQLADTTSATAGAGLVGYSDARAYATGTVGNELLQAAILRAGRSAPHANFTWFTDDFTIAGCAGPGRAVVAEDIYDVFKSKFSGNISSNTVYVHPSGSDANSGASWRSAYLTLSKALRSVACGVIYVWPGTYALSDFRYSDTHGDHAKLVIAPFGNVIVRVVGDLASSKTWTLDGDFGGQWNACITTASVKPIRVLKTNVYTPDGDYLPMPIVADRATMGATSNFGWTYEPTVSQLLTVTTNGTNTVTCASTKNLCVGMTLSGHADVTGRTVTAVTTNTSFVMDGVAAGSHAGIGITAAGAVLTIKDSMSANVESNKANYDVVYGDAGGDNRILLLSSTSYWEGITLYGYFSPLVQGGQATPQLWLKNCRMLYGNTSHLLVQGAYCYTQDCLSAYGNADGANYNVESGITSRGVEINYTTRWMGDPFTYGGGASQPLNPISTGQNKNGSSNHDSYLVRVNGSHKESFGPVIGDTASSFTWNLGVSAGHCALDPNTWPTYIRAGFIVQGGSAWLDGCEAHGQDYSFQADSSASVHTFNTFGTTVTTTGGSFAEYLPA